MLGALLGVVLGILLPPSGLNPLAIVVWFGILLAPIGATAGSILRLPSAGRAARPAARAIEQAPKELEQAAPAIEQEAQPVVSPIAAPAKRRKLTPEERAQREHERIERKAERERQRQARQEAQEARQAAQQEKARQRAERAAQKAQQAAQKAQQAAEQAQRLALTQAFGADPNTRYSFRFRVVDLDALIPSNLDNGSVNPAYDATLQPRQRDRAASQRQIEQVARSLVPETLLWDFKQLDKGAPIVGPDLMVESGNGRTLALRRARLDFPEQFASYQAKLAESLAAVGLDASALEGKSAPVLVRERLSDVDRAAFAREANAPPVLQMSTLETALIDSRRISDAMIFQLTVKEEQSIDQALRAKSNAAFVRGFLGTLTENEAGALLRKNGTLNQAGIWRIKAALFTRVFPGESGARIADTFLESLDSTTKNFESAISTALPVLARAESLIASGQRSEDLRLTEDISKAIDMLARLREDDTPVAIYREQATMFDRELTTFQEELLGYFDEIGRSPKQIRSFLNAYADAVESAPDPNQTDLFGDVVKLTKEDVYTRITGRKVAA